MEMPSPCEFGVTWDQCGRSYMRLRLRFRLYNETGSKGNARQRESVALLVRSVWARSFGQAKMVAIGMGAVGMRAVSKAESRYMEAGIAQDLRADGRGRLHFRGFSVEAGIIPQANGSARVRLGGTHVIASVKAELGSPSAGRPSHGQMHVSVDCSPQIGGGDGDELSLELSRALHRCLLGGASGAGAAIDLTALALLDGKLCWLLYIDALVLSSDGNLLDCISMAVKAALADTGIPKVEITGAEGGGQVEVDVDDDTEGFSRLDASRVPVVVTLTKVGKDYIVDATAEEEQSQKVSAAVSVAVNSTGRITGVVKRTGAGLHPTVLVDMLALARQVGQKLIPQVEDVTARNIT